MKIIKMEKFLTANNITVLSTFIISLIGFLAVFLDHKRKSMSEKKEDIKNDTDNRKIKQAQDISYLLVLTLNECKCDRIYIYLFDKNKNEYLETLSCEYEFVTQGTAPEMFNGKLSSKTHEKFFENLKNDNFLVYPDITMLPSPTREFFIDRGSNSSVFYLLLDNKNKIKGFLGVDYIKEKLEDINILDVLLKNAEQINYKLALIN